MSASTQNVIGDTTVLAPPVQRAPRQAIEETLAVVPTAGFAAMSADQTLLAAPDLDRTMIAAAGLHAHDAADHRELVQGSVIGRYVVLSKLGAGGMGIVYAAYDPELDRKIALKLLLPASGGSNPDGTARLLREAQALAKLSHPNVVSVHDVGAAGDNIWIAMEFIQGRTLSQWREERRRSWREVLDVIRPAALGLTAAHKAGLIHRDVKPDNIMIGDDGRVRVMDFGLARGAADARDPPPPSQASRARADLDRAASVIGNSRLHAELTQYGATPGTPAYMAPEQLDGVNVDARIDQFALCITLWEALYGERPFVGDTLLDLLKNIREDHRRPPPKGVVVPHWLHRVLVRGLANRPEHRWPSLDALLEALDDGRARARTARLFAGLFAVGTLSALAFGARELDHQRRVDSCHAAGDSIVQIWGAPQRSALRRSLIATGAEGAEVTAEKVIPWLDQQAQAWAEARVSTCLDDQVTRVATADQTARALWCLDERRFELAAVIDALQDPAPGTVTHAVSAVAALKQISPCRDSALLARLPLPPLARREPVEALRKELSAAAALASVGAYVPALERSRAAHQRAIDLDWPPLRAAAGLQVGTHLIHTGAFAEAERTLEAAYFEAVHAGAPEDALVAAQALIFAVGYSESRPAEGERWWRHAEAIRASLPDPIGIYEAEGLDTLCTAQFARGAYVEAARSCERALFLRERALGPDHPQIAQSLNNLGAIKAELGAYDEAIVAHTRALSLRERALGSGHPDVAISLSGVGFAKAKLGAYDEAIELYERALALRERTLPADHPNIAHSLGKLGELKRKIGALDQAARLSERALGIRERVLGPDHPDVAAILDNLGGIQSDLGAYEQAETLYHRALSIREASLGPDHPHVAESLLGLGRVALARGRYDVAGQLAARALTIRQASGISGPGLAAAQDLLAEAQAGAARAVELGPQR